MTDDYLGVMMKRRMKGAHGELVDKFMRLEYRNDDTCRRRRGVRTRGHTHKCVSAFVFFRTNNELRWERNNFSLKEMIFCSHEQIDTPQRAEHFAKSAVW